MLCCTRSFLSLSKQLKCILVDIDKAHKTTGHSSIFHPARLMFWLFNISYRSLAWICCLIMASKGIINCWVHLFDHTCPSSVFVYSYGLLGVEEKCAAPTLIIIIFSGYTDALSYSITIKWVAKAAARRWNDVRETKNQLNNCFSSFELKYIQCTIENRYNCNKAPKHLLLNSYQRRVALPWNHKNCINSIRMDTHLSFLSLVLEETRIRKMQSVMQLETVRRLWGLFGFEFKVFLSSFWIFSSCYR
jgi:hypothetical protein